MYDKDSSRTYDIRVCVRVMRACVYWGGGDGGRGVVYLYIY